VTLSQFRGAKHVLLVFYPLAFTRGCHGELSVIRDDLTRFQNDLVQILTVSVDSSASHRVWAEREGFSFPLLADFWPHGDVAQTYGVFDDQLGYAVRATFVIDKDLVIRWRGVNAPGEVRDQAHWDAALAEIGVGV
jgi:mycoredoxin-dependent peroxiredoxin